MNVTIYGGSTPHLRFEHIDEVQQVGPSAVGIWTSSITGQDGGPKRVLQYNPALVAVMLLAAENEPSAAESIASQQARAGYVD